MAGGRVYVATEDDRVYALAATTGAVLWSTRVGTAVPAASLPCGDIQPTVGITGTPVIDPVRGEVFVVADELVGGSPKHVLVGLDATSGQIEMTQKVDPPGALGAALLQRTGLTLDAGQVVFGFGGNYGDCSTYRGWVVAVGESGGTPRLFAVDGGPGEEQGAIWMGGGAPAVDGQGNIWVSAGNGSVVSPGHAYDDSDSVLELSPALQLKQFFAPTNWAADNAADRDLSMEPVLLRRWPGGAWPASPGSPFCWTAPTSVASAASRPHWHRSAGTTLTAAGRWSGPSSTCPAPPGSWPCGPRRPLPE